MNVVFRVDDLYLDGSEFENNLLDIFEKNGIPLTLGVIPFHKDGSPIVRLLNEKTTKHLESKLFNIALHGFKHVKSNEHGEFYGVPADQQNEWVLLGTSHIQGLIKSEIDTFIPPWNALDNNTIKVLSDNQYKYYSAALDNSLQNKDLNLVSVPYSVEHLYFLKSITFKLMCFLSYFGLFKSTTIVILFHPYNFVNWLGKPYFKGEKKKFNSELNEFAKRLNVISNNKNIVFKKLNNLHSNKYYKNHCLEFIYKLECRRPLALFSDCV